VLGFEAVSETSACTRMAIAGGAAGRRIDVLEAPDGPRAINGLGTVHHVAMAVASGDDQLKMRHELMRLNVPVTEVMDRQYFTSIYFREPGGVLFEIATMGPGFTDDEPLEQLGLALKLPPWEEAARRDIESGLARIVVPAPLSHARA
jgi:glyoxalase family protein